MDEYVLQYYWKQRLSKINIDYVIEQKFTTNHKYGVAFYTMGGNTNVPKNWRTCLETWMDYNQHHIEEMERYYRTQVIDNLLVS